MVEVKADVAELKTDMVEVKADVAELKTDMAEVKVSIDRNYSLTEEFYVMQKEHNTRMEQQFQALFTLLAGRSPASDYYRSTPL